MRYPEFYDMYRDAIKNTWTVEEIDFSDDVVDLDRKLMPTERHLINRLVAFFTPVTPLSLTIWCSISTNTSIAPKLDVSESPAVRGTACSVLSDSVDNYIPDHNERAEAFAAIENIPSIRHKADFCFKWMGSIDELTELRTQEDRKQFL